jgi:RNA polymerase sigma factor (sigma-70 family)
MNKEQKALGEAQIGVTELDVARITAVFQECRESLERFLVFRLQGRTEEAKELAQETYMRLITRRKRREVSNWQGLMFCTARNLANNKLKQHRIRRAADALIQIEIADHRTPEISWTEVQTAAAVRRAMDELPRRWRHVLARHGEGQTFKQIALELGINERTCRRDVARAILSIQQKIGLG